MAVKVQTELGKKPGWDRVEEYGNIRLSEEGLQDFNIFIRSVLINEIHEMGKEQSSPEDVAFDEENLYEEILHIEMLLGPDRELPLEEIEKIINTFTPERAEEFPFSAMLMFPAGGILVEPETFVEANIIDLIQSIIDPEFD